MIAASLPPPFLQINPKPEVEHENLNYYREDDDDVGDDDEDNGDDGDKVEEVEPPEEDTPGPISI